VCVKTRFVRASFVDQEAIIGEQVLGTQLAKGISYMLFAILFLIIVTQYGLDIGLTRKS